MMTSKAQGWEQLERSVGSASSQCRKLLKVETLRENLRSPPETHFPHPGPTSWQVSLTFQHCDSDIVTTKFTL